MCTEMGIVQESISKCVYIVNILRYFSVKIGQNAIFYNYRGGKRPFRYRHTTVKPSVEILEDKVEEIFQKLVWKKKIKDR